MLKKEVKNIVYSYLESYLTIDGYKFNKSQEQIENFELALSEIAEVKVQRDNRELFIIYSNDDIIINRIVDFLNRV